VDRVTAELVETLTKVHAARATDPEFARLRDFYFEMQRLGLLVKKAYDLPPLDTIGRTTFADPDASLGPK